MTESYTFEPGRFDPDRLPGIERLDAAAAAGDPEALYQITFIRTMHAGHHAEVVATFKRLAAGGHVGAARMLASFYQSGQHVPLDYDRAAYWLEHAARLGDQDAAHDLATYRAYVIQTGARDTLAAP